MYHTTGLEEIHPQDSLGTTSHPPIMADSASPGATSADPAAFLSSLPEPLNQYAEAALPLTSAASDLGATAGQRIDELEISVRGHLLTLASSLLDAAGGGGGAGNTMDTSDSSSALAAVLTYLRSTIDLCLHIVQLAEELDASDGPPSSNPPACYKDMAHAVVRKLPFVLLEDTIDALPPSILKTIWTSGPTDWIADLAAAASSSPSPGGAAPANLFQRGSQFLLLKSCNKLLRKLSNRDRDAAFAGSVMTLLAKVFPLSERSAVNVLGTFNVTNVTDFEDEETFRQHALGAGVGGAEGTDDVTMEDAADQKKKNKNNKKKNKIEDEGNDEDAESVDYPFYKTFWGVQKVFTDPSTILGGIKDGTTSSGGAASGGSRAGKAPPAAAAAAAEAFNAQPAMDFVQDVRTVLTALEGRPFPDEVVRQSKSR